MSFSDGGLAVVDNGRSGLLGYDLASGCNAKDDIFATVVENVSFIVKTFESNYFNSSERKRQTEFNGFHLLDQFENSYFSLVNDKINRLEWRGIERPVHEKNRAGDKDSSEMVTILGDVWIAEFVVPVDFELFKKILTGAIYTMCHNLKPFVVQYTQPFASEDPPDGKNSRKTINSVEEPVAHTNSYSKAGEVDSHYAKAPEDPPSIDKPDDMINPVPIPVREKTGGPGRPKKARSTGWRGRPRSLRPLRPSRLHEEAEPVTNQIEEEKQEEPVEKVNVEQVDQEEYEYEKHEHEEDFDPDEEFDLPKRTRRSPDKPRSPVDGGNGNYLKTEHFAQLLANCPFFSGHKVINAAIASKKAASIIDKLTKDADIPKSQSSEEESEVSDSVHLSTESIQRATESFELMDLNGNLSLIPDAVKRSTKKKYKRTYTSIPRYLKRSKHRSRHAFLQKLNALVDRITTKYINRKKNEIVCENFYQTITDPTEYLTGTYGWNHDPYRSNRQGRTKGHGLYLSCADVSTPRSLEHLLNDPFNIPWVSTDRVGHREIVKRMFQDL